MATEIANVTMPATLSTISNPTLNGSHSGVYAADQKSSASTFSNMNRSKSNGTAAITATSTSTPTSTQTPASTSTAASATTPMKETDTTDEPLFSTSLISPEVASALPRDYTVRALRRSDYNRGYLDVLRVLTTVGDVSERQWNDRYDWMVSRGDEYYLLVIVDGSDRIVGTGSLIVERKFIHSLGMVGHIEDIAVEKGQQGMKLGLRIIQALDFVASHVGCYKVSFSVVSFSLLVSVWNEQ